MSPIGPPRPNRQVLVACDEPAPWVDGLTGFLRDKGVSLRRARTAEESLGLVTATPFDVAFVGERLPAGGGIDLLRAIRAVRNGLPCVYVARRATGGTLRLALELEAFSVLREPVPIDVATRLIRRIYDRNWGFGIDDGSAE